MACASSPTPVRLVIWNQTKSAQEATIRIDGITVFQGTLPTTSSEPQIVHWGSVTLGRGTHTVMIETTMPGDKTLTFDVRRNTDLNIWFTPDGVRLQVRYGKLVYI